MKIAIIGEKNRASAWEKHLRMLSIIKEVIISSRLVTDDTVDAAILLDDSPTNLQSLLEAIKHGLHTYLVAKLPADQDKLEKVYHASEEAKVNVQFSHWPTIAPSMQWLKLQIDRPDLIQIKKEIAPVNFKIDEVEFEHQWSDELAFVIKWLGGNVHRTELKPVLIENTPLCFNITLRFEDASVASIQFSAVGKKDFHQRIISNRHLMADCDIITQQIRVYRINEQKRITIQEKAFDPSDTAQWSVVQFIKSIQMKQPSIFTPYDALRVANVVANTKALLQKN